MSSQPPFEGPLHLRRYLGEESDVVGKAIRAAVSHSVSIMRSVHCTCPTSGVMDSAGMRMAAERAGSSGLLPAGTEPKDDRRQLCRLFAVELNEEDGVIKAFCRRCQKMFIIFDQTLYWGMRRKTGIVPKTYPYRCSCGGHAFEIGIGFDYYEDAIDENDIGTISVAVRCAACDEISMILDEEAS
ncbi:MAG: hypothetical protein HY291_18690 [Planctomycetes bacterium]|nr:hypothetical protein [Planctomycetota bacterium]